MRKNLLQNLTHGRTEARAYLYEHLLFAIQQIESFPTIASARQAGVEIVFPNASEEESAVCARESIPGSIWDIPFAKTTSVKVSRQRYTSESDSGMQQENKKMLKDLQKKFPNRTVLVKYKRTVTPKIGTVTSPDDVILWPVQESVSLHAIAAGCLIEAFKCKDVDMLLSSAPFSLKAIHILAIGLRGLLRQSLGLPLSTIERTALGEVTHKSVRKGENKVTAMMSAGATTKRKRKNDLRYKKLFMAWEAYIVEKERREEADRVRGERSVVNDRSDDGEVEDDDDDEDDDDEWMNSTGQVRM